MPDEKWTAGEETVSAKIHLFGVNNLTTQEVLALFDAAGGAEKVEWLDDSSCNVILSDDDKVQAILNGYSSLEDGWVRTDPIPLDGKDAVVLDLRRATTTDVKNQTRKWQESDFYRKRLEKSHVVMIPAKGAKTSGVVLTPAPRNSRTVVTKSGVVLEPRRRSRSRSRDWQRKDRSMGLLADNSD